MVTISTKELQGAFIIPHYADGSTPEFQKKVIDDTINGIFNQTDNSWKAIIIDDCSTDKNIIEHLKNIKNNFPEKIEVKFLTQNVGPGICRNIGVLWALKQGCDILLFNDSDDISHPKRLEIVKDIFQQDSNIGLIYSTFMVIDENNNLTPLEKISPPILEILESHKRKPLEGKDVWIKMGTDNGYTNKTSSTAVRTNIAYHCLFPNERASEDYHTWMRMSAYGAYYRYTPIIPTKYRIPSFMKYQMSRTRIGPNNFNKIKSRVDSDGFSKAIEMALIKGSIKPQDVPILKTKFYRRLASSMHIDGEIELEKELLAIAESFSIEGKLYINNYAGI